MTDQVTAAGSRSPWHDDSRSPQERVDALVAAMTVPEKLAQLYGVWVGVSPVGGDVAPFQHELTDGVDFDAVIQNGLGQLTRPFGTRPVTAREGAASLALAQRQMHGFGGMVKQYQVLPDPKKLLRVVLDSGLRMPLDSKLVTTADGDVVVYTACEDPKRIEALAGRGVRVEVLPAESGRVPLGLLLDRLGSEGVLTLLTETGSRLNTALLGGSFVDRMTVFCSSQILGSDAVPAFRGLPLPARLVGAEMERIGEDLRVSGLLRDPWEN